MLDNPWRQVFYLGYGINPTIKSNQIYEFGRDEWDETLIQKLDDFHPMANIIGLKFREV